MPPMYAALLAQQTAELTETLELWHALIAAVAPIVLGLITNGQTRRSIKKFLPVLVSVGASLITRFAGTDAGAEVIVIVPIMWAAIKMLYEGYSGIVSILRGADLSINDVLAPNVKLVV